MSSSRLRSSISPFRSRKSSSSSSSSSKRPTTPSSTTSAKAPTLPPAKSSFSPSTPSSDYPPGSSGKTKENVTVTVRFRPLNAREIGKGDELAWYADGDYTVRNENNPKIAYSFDKVFGSATTTRHVYDVAAQHVVAVSGREISHRKPFFGGFFKVVCVCVVFVTIVQNPKLPQESPLSGDKSP
uniref:Kinesin-like protein NACK1 n=1 Tax=Nicotiana tabacum TaxID=4097 RepID=A0A1S3ZBC3_TOBAC|nr:PREDICTED: kinesin-like protein NACK1 [Nicotiana tabacum]